MTEIELEPRDDVRPNFTVEVTLDDEEDVISLMEAVVVAGTDIGEKTVPLLSIKELAQCYSAVVSEMDR